MVRVSSHSTADLSQDSLIPKKFPRRFLRESIQRLIDAFPDPLWITNRHGRIRVANRAARDKYGFRQEDWVRVGLAQLLCPDDPSQFQRLSRELAQDGYYYFESRHRTRKGQRFPGETRVQVATLWRFPMWIVTAQDNSDLHRAAEAFEASQARFRSIFVHAATGMATLVPDGYFLQVNRAFCDFVGFRAKRLTSMSLAELVPEEDAAQLKLRLKAGLADRKRPQHFEQRFLRRNGDMVWGQVSIAWLGGQAQATEYGVLQVRDITTNKEMEASLRHSEQHYRNVVESVRDVIFRLDEEARIQYVNPAWEQVTGWPAGEALQRPLNDFFDAEGRRELQRLLRRVRHSPNREAGAELSSLTRHGQRRWVEIKLHRMQGSTEPGIISGTLQDITERRNATLDLEAERSFLQTVIDGVIDPILVIDLDRRVRMMNHAARQQSQGGENFVPRGIHCYQINHPLHQPCAHDSHPCPMEEVLQSGRPVRVVHCHLEANGRQKVFQVQASPLFDPQDGVTGIIESIRDVSYLFEDLETLGQMEARLNLLGEIDPVTRMPNRNYFSRYLDQLLKSSVGQEVKGALLLVKVEGPEGTTFAPAGRLEKDLSRSVAGRLRGSLRESDIVATLDWNQFAILLQEIEDRENVATVAKKVLMAIDATTLGDDQNLKLSAALGIALYPPDGRTSRELILAAYNALNCARMRTPDRYCFFSEEEATLPSTRKNSPEKRLQQAFQQERLKLRYQPRVELDSGRLAGLEARVVWPIPGQGSLELPDFIKVAATARLVRPLTQWSLRKVCLQGSAWQAQGLDVPRLSVKIPHGEAWETGLVDVVWHALEESGLDPDCLELVIEERLLNPDIDVEARFMWRLRSLGVHIALSGYGAETSSLRQWTSLPLSRLEICAGMIRRLPLECGEAAILKASVLLAHGHGLSVTADGILSAEHRQQVVEAGCDAGQGPHISAPISAAKAMELVSGTA